MNKNIAIMVWGKGDEKKEYTVRLFKSFAAKMAYYRGLMDSGRGNWVIPEALNLDEFNTLLRNQNKKYNLNMTQEDLAKKLNIDIPEVEECEQ